MRRLKYAYDVGNIRTTSDIYVRHVRRLKYTYDVWNIRTMPLHLLHSPPPPGAAANRRSFTENGALVKYTYVVWSICPTSKLYVRRLKHTYDVWNIRAASGIYVRCLKYAYDAAASPPLSATTGSCSREAFLSHTMYQLNDFRKSNPPRNRSIFVVISDSQQ